MKNYNKREILIKSFYDGERLYDVNQYIWKERGHSLLQRGNKPTMHVLQEYLTDLLTKTLW